RASDRLGTNSDAQSQWRAPCGPSTRLHCPTCAVDWHHAAPSRSIVRCRGLREDCHRLSKVRRVFGIEDLFPGASRALSVSVMTSFRTWGGAGETRLLVGLAARASTSNMSSSTGEVNHSRLSNQE